MNKSLQTAGALLFCMAIASCTGNSTTSTTTTDSTAAGMSPGDSAVTTTTTTTVTHHKYAGTFQPQPNMKYIDLKTHKQVTVRIDTVQGTIVNSETNQPMDLFVAPGSHDTIYGQTGTVVNNYITRDQSGDYSVDQARMSSSNSNGSNDMNNSSTSAANTTSAAASTDATPAERGKYKEKASGKTKLKTEDEKIKEKGDKVKIKER